MREFRPKNTFLEDRENLWGLDAWGLWVYNPPFFWLGGVRAALAAPNPQGTYNYARPGGLGTFMRTPSGEY